MPIYKFKCKECGVFEEMLSIDEEIDECPECGNEVKKIIGCSNAHYRAPGFTKSTTHL